MPAIRASRCVVYVIAAVSLWCGRAQALNPELDLSQYAHTAWNVRNGFPSGVVYAIAQTPDGYIWLGTEFGLVRFDGVRGVSWQLPEGQRLSSDDVRALAVSRDGAMWIGTTAGLARWDGKTLTRYPELAGRVVSSIVGDRGGTVWAGSGLVDSTAKICAIRPTGTDCFGDDGSLGKSVRLHEDRGGNLWVATERGLWRWAPGPPRVFSPSPDPRVVIDGSDGELVVATQNSIRSFADEKFGPELMSIPDSTVISSALRDRDGALWVGTSGGLLHRHEGRSDSYTRVDGLPDDRVVTLFEDREGNIWVTTVTGLNRFREYAIPAIGDKQGVQGFASAVETTNDGALWVGTSRGLYKSLNGAMAPYRHAVAGRTGPSGKNGARNGTGQPRQEAHRPLTIESAVALHADKRRRLWISNAQKGVFYIDGDALVTPVGLRSVVARSISEDDHDLWLVDYRGALFRIRSDDDMQASAPQTLGRSGGASSVLADPTGGLWIGFLDGGIGLLRNGELHRVPGTGEGGGTGASVWNLYLDRGHTLWAATQRGLVRISQGRRATLTSKEGLPCDAVHWVTEDDAQSFWVGLACGVARVDRAELAAWSADPTRKVRVQTFGREDGVINGAVAYGGEPRVAKARDGKLYFHSSDGVGVIDPLHLPVNKLPPPVHVEEVVADRVNYTGESRLRFPPLVRDLEIHYTALSLVAPEKVSFKYKLEGRDKDWQETDRRRAYYTDLPPGDYRFRVIAANNSGVWNEQGDALDFTIPPAWWQTNWFRALCVTALALLFYIVYRLRVAQIARHFNATLDARVNERTRIARELHDTLLQSFHGLLLRFQMALELMPSRPDDATKILASTIDQAADAITEGRDAVQGLRTSATEGNDLADGIRSFGKELADDSGDDAPELRVDVQGTSRALHPIVRDEIFRIASEALRNAFRHANAKHIEVELRYDDREMRLRVRDDGRGIDQKVLTEGGREGHFGLRGMRERATVIGGKLTVWSGLDAGTEVELSVPGSRGYASPAGTQRSGLLDRFTRPKTTTSD